ncbi:MAG TPA: sigma 54-interacting transcriptional regulator [Bryobacteraceae bacterium]|nr:sigma 54-interacting transcriptional regulator [Bryobacteraceae bacterium]
MSNEPTAGELCRVFEEHGFITRSPSMLPVLRLARKAATVSDVTVLLVGETGTGKQVLAQAIHSLDEKRKSYPFITVHCSTITEALAESELFGHERGAFSGATRHREGLFQAAHRGTLFLDDVNDLPASLQPKLLDVLQRGIVRRVGSDRETRIDVRVISAANQPLEPLVQQNRFRQDLYHRLNVVKLRLPALRERPADVAALILSFARRHRNLYPEIATLDPELVLYLESRDFPGNVRELEHAVQRMLFFKAEGTALEMADWNVQSNDAASSEAEGDAARDLVAEAAQRLWSAISERGVPYWQAIQLVEKKLLERALQVQGQTRRDMAKRLRTSERTLYHKLRAHNLTRATVSRASLPTPA